MKILIKLLNNITKNLINTRILPRLLIIYCTVIILPIAIISILIFFNAERSIENAYRTSFSQAINSISVDLEKYSDLIEERSLIVSKLLEIRNDDVNDVPADAVLTAIDTLCQSNMDLFYTIYTDDPDFNPSAPNCRIVDISQIENKPWFLEAMEAKSNIYWQEANISNGKNIVSSELVGIRSVDGKEYRELVSVSANLYILESQLDLLFRDYDSTFYLLDSFGNQIYSVHSPINSPNYALPASKEIIADVVLNHNGSKIIKDPYRGEIMFTYTTFDDMSWKLLVATPVIQLTTPLYDSLFWVTILLITCLFLFIFATLFLNRTISTPLDKIIHAMRNPKLNVPLNEYENRKDEIGDLTSSYLKRMEDVNVLLSEIEGLNEKKRAFQMEALQGQINFHFIYNTLNNIQWLAQANKNDDVIATVTALDKLLRACVNSTEDLISIEDELDYVENYLTAQKIRFGDMFSFEFELDALLLQMKIPRFVLQPIVENSIYHGLMNSGKNNGLIKIKLSRRGHRIDIRVFDNGAGVSPDKIQKILAEHKGTGKSMGVALSNINKRVKLLFGNDYGIGITSEEGEYTAVDLTIPIVS